MLHFARDFSILRGGGRVKSLELFGPTPNREVTRVWRQLSYFGGQSEIQPVQIGHMKGKPFQNYSVAVAETLLGNPRLHLNNPTAPSASISALEPPSGTESEYRSDCQRNEITGYFASLNELS